MSGALQPFGARGNMKLTSKAIRRPSTDTSHANKNTQMFVMPQKLLPTCSLTSLHEPPTLLHLSEPFLVYYFALSFRYTFISGIFFFLFCIHFVRQLPSVLPSRLHSRVGCLAFLKLTFSMLWLNVILIFVISVKTTSENQNM